MAFWNVYLDNRKRPVKVKKVLRKDQNFMVIVDTFGKQHQLSEIDFPSFEWKNIGAGSTIILNISESVTGWRVQAPRVGKTLRKLIAEASKNTLGCYFIWICQDCGAEGYIEYADGDDHQRIAERILKAHEEGNKSCYARNIHLFDHRGIRQEESERFLSSCEAAL